MEARSLPLTALNRPERFVFAFLQDFAGQFLRGANLPSGQELILINWR
jgi:hypothetical protein